MRRPENLESRRRIQLPGPGPQRNSMPRRSVPVHCAASPAFTGLVQPLNIGLTHQHPAHRLHGNAPMGSVYCYNHTSASPRRAGIRDKHVARGWRGCCSGRSHRRGGSAAHSQSAPAAEDGLAHAAQDVVTQGAFSLPTICSLATNAR